MLQIHQDIGQMRMLFFLRKPCKTIHITSVQGHKLTTGDIVISQDRMTNKAVKIIEYFTAILDRDMFYYYMLFNSYIKQRVGLENRRLSTVFTLSLSNPTAWYLLSAPREYAISMHNFLRMFQLTGLVNDKDT